MTSKLVVNTIEADTGISSVSFASSISLSSTSVFHFGNAGLNIGGDLNINRPSAGVIGFNINGSEAARINANGFLGDGSQLTGLPAGLGTALSTVQTSPLNKLYYTDRILSIGSTVTIDHPASATGAYTQYADILVEDNADLIVADGDDLIPDILGLGGNGTTGAGGAGRLLVDNIVNRSGTGAPTLPNGAVVTGVCTATSFSGSGANLTNVPSFPTHIDIWRVTSDMGLSNGDYLTSNWNRAVQSSAEDQLTALKGAQVTQSSGVFTFPTTGIWQIMFQIEIYKNGACRWFEAGVIGTIDNFSSERVLATGYGSLFSSGANTHTSVRTSTFYKVSNVSNNKIKFRVNMAAGVTNESSSTKNNTWVEFVRVSDI